MKWGNVIVTKKVQDGENFILNGTVNPEDKDFKKTKKLTWIVADPAVTFTFKAVEFDHIITKAKVEDTDDMKDIVNHNSKQEYECIGEGAIKNLAKGSIIQIERRGYFYIDDIGFRDGAQMVLHFIPDGTITGMSVVKGKLDAKEVAKGKGNVGGVNKSELKKKGN